MTSQILALVDSNELLIGKMPTGLKEGELLPETYDIRWGDTKAEVITRMQKAMKDTLVKAWESRVDNLPFSTPQEALILASVIEKETAVPEERRRIAGVFFNRLRRNMRLQTDPTVIYALTKGKYVLERPLSKKDLAIDSPYNTYTHAGLPPAPIANPGRDAIFAAVSPMMTGELYFVADGSGGHAFSNTLDEHVRNVREWRKIQKSIIRKD